MPSIDPMDVHVDKAAFLAAYTALQGTGVTLAQVRGDVAERVSVAVLAERTAHGLDHLRNVCTAGDQQDALAQAVKADLPEMYTSVKLTGLRAAVAAAARALVGED